MKKIPLILFIVFLISYSGASQCSISNDIQDDYLTDAWIMVFREFAENPSHPDYNIPILDAQKTVPYLEKLSAIYDLADTNQVIDSLFNEFKIHTSSSYPSDIFFGKIYLEIDGEPIWLQDFIDTGISGVPALDQLMSTYEFSITNVSIVDPPGSFFVEIESNISYLNHFALLDDFEAIEDILSTAVAQGDGTNYVGIPYLINGEEVVASNIVIIDDVYRFSLHVDFCGASCEVSRGWDIQISEDCSQVTIEELEILNSPDFDVANMRIFPNPVSNILTIEAKDISIKSVEIFSALGTKIPWVRLDTNAVDVSGLRSGLYFIKLISVDGGTYIHKFLKK